MALDLEVEVVVMDCKGERDDASSKVVLLEEGGEELAECLQPGIVTYPSFLLFSQMDVDIFVDF